MEKNMKILIIAVVLIILVIIVTVMVNKMNNDNEEQKRINNAITMNEISEEQINEIEEKLKENGLDVQIKESIYSELLGEEGKICNVNGVEFEIYQVNDSKIRELTQENQGEVIINGENGRQEEGLVFGDIVILKCIDEGMKEKITEIFTQENEENRGIISINNVKENS